jgi:hypothetical protein
LLPQASRNEELQKTLADLTQADSEKAETIRRLELENENLAREVSELRGERKKSVRC